MRPHWYRGVVLSRRVEFILGEMARCHISEELALQYLMALDSVDSARLNVNHAVTQTQMECASTLLYRVEAHKLNLFAELAKHLEGHACATPEIGALITGTGRRVVRG